MLVFVGGQWIQVELPLHLDPAWSESDRVLYATALAKARGIGLHAPVAVAEALTIMVRYPGTTFDSVFMKEVLALRDAVPGAKGREETT